jgi:hypothetical protein
MIWHSKGDPYPYCAIRGGVPRKYWIMMGPGRINCQTLT